MALDHERLEVYQVALELFDLIDDIVEHLPRGRGHLADQLSRAGLSVVNNIADGAGKFSPGCQTPRLPHFKLANTHER
jgi:four helix bundle protein